MTVVDITIPVDYTSVDFAAETFKKVSTDDQLLLLWRLYEILGDSIITSAPVAIFSQVTNHLFNQIKQVRRGDQIQVMRDLVSGANTRVCHEYGSLNANMKLAFWYKLAQGVRSGSLQGLPTTYRLGSEASLLLHGVESMGFNQQLMFLHKIIPFMDATIAR